MGGRGVVSAEASWETLCSFRSKHQQLDAILPGVASLWADALIANPGTSAASRAALGSIDSPIVRGGSASALLSLARELRGVIADAAASAALPTPIMPEGGSPRAAMRWYDVWPTGAASACDLRHLAVPVGSHISRAGYRSLVALSHLPTRVHDFVPIPQPADPLCSRPHRGGGSSTLNVDAVAAAMQPPAPPPQRWLAPADVAATRVFTCDRASLTGNSSLPDESVAQAAWTAYAGGTQRRGVASSGGDGYPPIPPMGEPRPPDYLQQRVAAEYSALAEHVRRSGGADGGAAANYIAAVIAAPGTPAALSLTVDALRRRVAARRILLVWRASRRRRRSTRH